MEKVAVIDYGMSNLRSVAKALQQVSGARFEIRIHDKPEQILSADRIVFPGQGAIGTCMETLRAQGLEQVLLECIRTKPFLGLCLGLQTLLDFSDEDGGTKGLGVVSGRVVRFPEHQQDAAGNFFKIPHMGWNRVIQQRQHPLWNGIASGERFYFVHSYYVVPDDGSCIVGTTDYILEFASALARENFFAVQFHPEKSQRAGLRLLKNFLDWSVD